MTNEERLDQAAKAGADAWQAEMKACTLDEAVRAMTFQDRVNVIVERTERARAKAIIESWEASGEAIKTIRQRAGLEE